MHSLASKLISLYGKKLMKEEHAKQFDPYIKWRVEATELGNEISLKPRYDHPILFYSLCKARCVSLEEGYAERNDFGLNPADYWGDKTIKKIYSIGLWRDYNTRHLFEIINRYVNEFKSFKNTKHLLSFEDVIDGVVADNFPQEKIPTFELLIIDEAQDLSKHLWKFAKRLISSSKTCFIAGDDDQAIMESFGASPETFNNLQTSEKNHFLGQSYRIPTEVKNYVEGKSHIDSGARRNKPQMRDDDVEYGVLPLIKRIPGRVEKEWKPKEEKGQIFTYQHHVENSQSQEIKSKISPSNLSRMYKKRL